MPKSDDAHLQGSTAQISSKLIISWLQYSYRTLSSACRVTGALERRVPRRQSNTLDIFNAKSKDQVCVDMSDHNPLCKNEEECHRKKSTTHLECSTEIKMFLEGPRETNLGDLNLFLDEPLFLTVCHDHLTDYHFSRTTKACESLITWTILFIFVNKV